MTTSPKIKTPVIAAFRTADTSDAQSRNKAPPSVTTANHSASAAKGCGGGLDIRLRGVPAYIDPGIRLLGCCRFLASAQGSLDRWLLCELRREALDRWTNELANGHSMGEC